MQRDIHYTGHSPHFDGLQGHSVGDHFPFVVVAYETGGDSRSRVWGVIGPGRDHPQAEREARSGTWGDGSHTAAVGLARLLAYRYRRIVGAQRLYEAARGAR